MKPSPLVADARRHGERIEGYDYEGEDQDSRRDREAESQEAEGMEGGSKMQQHFGERYIIKSLKDEYGLGWGFETIEDARNEIDNSNKRAIDQGYKAEQFIICKEQIMKVWEGDRKFVMSTVVTTAIETYPETL